MLSLAPVPKCVLCKDSFFCSCLLQSYFRMVHHGTAVCRQKTPLIRRQPQQCSVLLLEAIGSLCKGVYMGVSINGGTPIAGWFRWKNHEQSNSNRWFGGTPILGNLHILLTSLDVSTLQLLQVPPGVFQEPHPICLADRVDWCQLLEPQLWEFRQLQILDFRWLSLCIKFIIHIWKFPEIGVPPVIIHF